MILEETLKNLIQKATQDLFNFEYKEIHLQETRKEFEGTHTFVVFPLTKASQKSPEETGKLIGEYLLENTEIISKYNVVKGFLNLSITDKIWIEQFKAIVGNPDFGKSQRNGQKVMVEYSSPNTNKPLHLGHLRNIFLGWSLAKILEMNGYEVFRTSIVNDRGIHICKSMLAYQKFGNGETPESSGLKGDHLIGKYYVEFDKAHKAELEKSETKSNEKNPTSPILEEAKAMLIKWEQGDKETVDLWRKMNDWVYAGFNETYQKIGVSFDKIYYESQTYLLGKDIVEEGLTKQVFFKKEDGSVWIDLTAEKLDEKLVLRGDGTSVYITQDLGTADLKYADYQVDKSIYVVGNEQDYHFKVLFAILEKLNKHYAAGLYHLSYGMVDLPSGKMKSREGTVVDADDLIAEMLDIAKHRTNELGKTADFNTEDLEKLYQTIALGALKYFLLKVDPKKKMLFNPEESVDFQGDSAPFIQYNYARIQSILRKASEMNLDNTFENYQTLHLAELNLMQTLLSFPEKIEEAAKNYMPSVIAQYAYEIAKAYSKFFSECSIFQAENTDAMIFRVALSHKTAEVLQKTMDLLGINVPERM